MKLSADLPHETIRSLVYVKNHHYIELEDHKGNRTKLNATALNVGVCQLCHAMVATDRGVDPDTPCMHCKGKMTWKWSRPQLAFVAEKETDFVAWTKPDDKTADKPADTSSSES